MGDYPTQSVFRRTAMLSWLLLGGVAGLFWREVFSLAVQAF
jgi:hypothetical protein